MPTCSSAKPLHFCSARYSPLSLIRRAASVVLLSFAVATPAAHGADPIMPLSEVRPGMQCTGLSVVRGTAIASFDVEVIDVIADDPAAGGPRILIRVSGPAVDSTGVGPGFSGSPILCDGRNAGAISEGIGEYGNKVVLATPIESILSARPKAAPAIARRAPGLLRAARPLAGPLTVSGVSIGARRLLIRAARRVGVSVLSAPPGPQGGYPPQELRPGSTVAASISAGDVAIGAIGTVAYRDGDAIYAFGHPLDGLGRRSLFMQDAYVFSVIGNPLGLADLGASTYKLTSSGGHDAGAITNDTFSAISGRLGSPPASIPLRVTARRRGGGSSVTLNSRLADERSLGYGSGLSLVAPLAAQTALDRLLGDLAPATIRLCTRYRVRQLRRPMGFCNTYFDAFDALSAVAEAGSLVDDFDLAPLTVRGAAVSLAAEPGVVDDVIVGADGPARVRGGQTMQVRVALRRRGGRGRTVSLRVPVPRDVRPGRRTLVIEGNGFSFGGDEIVFEIVEELSRGSRRAVANPTVRTAQSEPGSVRELARELAALAVPRGITARFRGRPARLVLRSDEVRYDGRAELGVRVLKPKRPSGR
jgi:hypothetical protein